jgi:hypothetical protein
MKLALSQGLSGASSLSWRAAGVTTLGVRGTIEAIRLIAELAL